MKKAFHKKVFNAICVIFISLYMSFVSAQPVLFDFDNVSQYTSLPLSLTVSGITAHFNATGQGYSIQQANVMGFTPQGFAGNMIYPNSVYLADLLINFDQPLSDFSIMYACQELGCDDAATMRVTTYRNGAYVGTNTRTATYPGTWPSDTLRCSFSQGFDSVVVHYDHRPPTCQDYGVIYVADNMLVTLLNPLNTSEQNVFSELIFSNPVAKHATVSFYLLQQENVRVLVFDMTGRIAVSLFEGNLPQGTHKIDWDINCDVVPAGVYFLNLATEKSFRSRKVVVIK